MSTSRRSALAASLAACLVLGACGGSDPSSAPTTVGPSGTLAPPVGTGSATPTATTTVPVLPKISSDLVGDLQRVLDTRAAAVRAGDRAAFLDGLAAEPDLRTAEGGYFDNLAQLPVSTFSYRLEPASLVRSDDAYWGVVDVQLQLSPYDALPVRTVDRFRFIPTGPSAYVVSSTTDPAWEAEHPGLKQPWDTEPVRIREGAGVLGVFDSADRREAAGIVASVERGITDVAGRVPYTEWGQQAVVYALSDPRFLAGFDDLPGGDPQALDGVAFTVPAGTDDTSVASTRFALSPDLLPVASARRVDRELDRLVRHELVHVAVGDHDDAAPVWLSEGVAEWVSVQALPPAARDVPDRALAAATRGIDRMPSDESFNDDDAAVHYALAWWVCEWLAQTYGPDAPWTVMEAFSVRAGDDERDVVRDLLGFSVDKLAKRGAELMATTYAPPVTEAPTPTTPASPATPTDGTTIYD
ncbi:basic secretory protein-like protein [Nocardioides sp.]|uniref:basic secretory protein-like protein n=1 Tax=Nocardioides sp. TaxID=35761 RepID=UPI00271621A2|nr:basic secretory protein-like protein [Nocardioides sp.]MDO9456508.1 basic secretory protein-like protein [Nocardioides sp.]